VVKNCAITTTNPSPFVAAGDAPIAISSFITLGNDSLLTKQLFEIFEHDKSPSKEN
jgi:hypothetical protein